ncbi:MAG: hypothetical protein GC145_14220 [Caulobacter sp.]|nr:hypothetical protein [Caulobacter sp.]
MSRFLKSLMLTCALGAGGLSLSACVTPIPEYVPLSGPARAALTSTEVVAPIRQSEIYIYVAPVNTGGQGGLIGALVAAGIEAGNTSAAEEAVKPARDAVIDFNFDETLRQDLQTSLSAVDFLKVDGVRVVKDVSIASINPAISDSPRDAVLLTAADYQFSSDGSSVTVTLLANLFASSPTMDAFKPAKGGNTKDLSSAGNALYRGKFIAMVPLDVSTGKRETNIAAWSADGGAKLRKALNDGSAEVTGKLARDIQQPPPPVLPAPAK